MPQPTVLYGASGLPMQVDPTHQAARVSVRPMEFTTGGGSYSIGRVSGIMAAGLAGASPVVAVRWNPSVSTMVCLVRRIRFTAGVLGTAFTAGACTFAAFMNRNYTTAATGGTQLTLGGLNMRRATKFPPSQFATSSISVSATATLTDGASTQDANPFASFDTSVPNTAGVVLVPLPGNLFDPTEAGRYPLVLQNNEGYVIQATVPATGTWTFSWDMDWDEVPSY